MLLIVRSKIDSETRSKVAEDLKGYIKVVVDIHRKIISRDEAYKIGARAFFKEKYGETVKVYFVGDYSKEFCGGPHVENTKEISSIKIFKFEKIGANLYRIYAK